MRGCLLVSEEIIRQYEPREEWLNHKSELHGIGHMLRVLVLQELLCDDLERQGVQVDRTVTRFAAMTHDVGRIDDGVDPEHGWRSAEWIKGHLAESMSPETLDAVTYCVYWHAPHDDEAPVMTNELKVLKDADGLDRVRLGDLDESLLRTDCARELIPVAEKLCDESMLTGAPGGDFNSVLEAVKKLGMLAP